MSESRLIAIVSIPQDWAIVDVSELPVIRVDLKGEGDYSVPSTEVMEIALSEMLRSSDLKRLSAIFMIVRVVELKEEAVTEAAPSPGYQARRRRRRRGTPEDRI